MHLLVLAALFAITTAANLNPKRGIAWASNNPSDMLHVKGSTVSWEYRWNVQKPSPLFCEHVPMLWGSKDSNEFQILVLQQNPKVVLGPNEPEFPEQANLSVDQAVQLWKQFLQPLTSLGIRLGSPAISSAPAGKKWLKEFLNHCQGCSVDFIALHWYGEDWMNMRNYLLEMHALFPNYTIWLTEFAETRSDPAIIQKFMVNALPWLDSHAFIERYAWFCYARHNQGGLQSQLMDDNGNLNDLGRLYLEV